MRKTMLQKAQRILILLLVLGTLAAITGCSSYGAYRQASRAEQTGNWDEAVLQYIKALENDPGNITYRAALLRAKTKDSQVHFERGKQFRASGVIDRALVEYQQAVELDPSNQYARAELEHTRDAYNAARQNRELTSIDEMKKKARGARPQPPQLNPRSDTPISLEFPNEVSIFDIYRALGKAFGINILFDPQLKDQNIAIELKDVNAQAALETLMRAAGHFYKVVDEHSIIIAADNPQNRRTYEDLVIQTFFLSNAEIKEMTTILRSLIDAKKIATNDQLNAIILRDTADKVKVAERIIEANDKSKAEVVVDVELLQINTTRLRELGVALDSYGIRQSLDLGGTTSGTTTGTTGTTTGTTTTPQLHVSDLQFLNQSNWALTIPSVMYNFVKQNTEAQLLAKPQLRITEGEKANLVIGDRVPIPLTTFNTQNVGGAGGIVPITSFQYQDVGIRIDMEPRVHHNQEVTLKVKVEVSQLNGSIMGSGGQSQPIIGTRTIDSTIRLKDGETNFMAGLIRTDESTNDTGFPGLSEIPVIGRLFSDKRTQHERTDVILTITPHIIRQAEITQEDLLPIWVGTESNISFRGATPRLESEADGPFDGQEGTPEQIQDAIRRRIQRLPRGLRPGEAGAANGAPVEDGNGNTAPQQQPAQPPKGIDLVPTQPPSDIFRPAQPAQPPADENPPPNGQAANEAPEIEESAALPVASALGDGAASVASQPDSTGGGTAVGRGGAPHVAKASLRASVEGAGGVGSSQGAAVELSLTPQGLTVAPGDRFSVQIEASALDPVSHLPMTLAYDAKVLAVEKVEPGDFLGAKSAAQVLSDTSHAGRVVIGASRLGGIPGVAGHGTVAVVTFRALAVGKTRLGLDESRALDSKLKGMAISTRPADVTVGSKAGPDRQPAPQPKQSKPGEASRTLGG
jgi:general secretion pathway protein D